MTISTLKKRKDFLLARDSGIKWVMPAFVIQLANNETEAVRVGYTASKKVGGAVQRNKAKRRMRELIRKEAFLSSQTGKDIVMIARHSILNYDFQKLSQDLHQALQKLGLKNN